MSDDTSNENEKILESLFESDNAEILIELKDGQKSLSTLAKKINISEENINNFLEDAERDKDLLVYCYVGNSSKGASEYFVQKGFKNVFSLDGGYEEFSKNNE